MAIDLGLEEFVIRSAPLAPRTWFRLGGPAEYFASPASIEELKQVVQRCHSLGVAVRVLGGGRTSWSATVGSTAW